jgi:hypothetical protein
MSTSFNARINDVVIPNGSNASRAIFGDYEYSDASVITIQSPATLDALTFTIELSQDGSTWATATDGANDIPVPLVGEAIQYTEMLSSRYFRIKASGNVVADTTFAVTKQWVK